jgi:hypothetical protein
VFGDWACLTLFLAAFSRFRLPKPGSVRTIYDRSTFVRVIAMNTFETSATVEDQGQVRVTGVPFAPGTEVQVTIREMVATEDDHSAAKLEEARARMRDLFARVRARNTESVGPLRREELYDRKVLR